MNHKYVIVQTDYKYEIWDTERKFLVALISGKTDAKRFCAGLNGINGDTVKIEDLIRKDMIV